MAIKLVSTREAARINGVKALVYGLAGAGKTVLSSTAPKPVILSAESGLLSLRNFDLPVIEIRNLQDLLDANRWAYDSAEAKQFETVCLDSLSEIGETVLANAKKTAKDPRQAYGELIDRMGEVIRSFRDLPNRNVYFSAKQELQKDEATGITSYGPSMPGAKLAQSLPYFFDEVFQLGIGKAQDGTTWRFLRCKPDFQYSAKDRSGSLEEFERPDLSFIFAKIMQQGA